MIRRKVEEAFPLAECAEAAWQVAMAIRRGFEPREEDIALLEIFESDASSPALRRLAVHALGDAAHFIINQSGDYPCTIGK